MDHKSIFSERKCLSNYRDVCLEKKVESKITYRI